MVKRRLSGDSPQNEEGPLASGDSKLDLLIQKPIGISTLEAPRILSAAMSRPVKVPCDEARAMIMKLTQMMIVMTAKNSPFALGEVWASEERARSNCVTPRVNKFIDIDYPC